MMNLSDKGSQTRPFSFSLKILFGLVPGYLILNIILNYFGIKIMGMYGAAMATVITQGVSLLLCNLLFGKDGREVFLWQIKAINPRYIFIRR